MTANGPLQLDDLSREELLVEREILLARIQRQQAEIAELTARKKEQQRILQAMDARLARTRPPCRMAGCDRLAEGRRLLCSKHLQRERAYGSPEAPEHREHLTRQQVLDIMDLQGSDPWAVGQHYGIGPQQVKNIWSGTAWGYITREARQQKGAAT